MVKILITGANGLVGQTLVRKILSMPGFDLLATSASECKIKGVDKAQFRQMDITNQDLVQEVFTSFTPDVVIHCAALTQVDPCEQDPVRCDLVNIEGTRNVARASERAGSKFIFLSTDFVFDGLKGPYSEDDEPCPVSAYGWSKVQGEYITRSLRIPWAIVRTILVYGVTRSMNRSNLVTWVRDSLSSGKSIQVVDDQFRMPTLVDDLADGILAIIERKVTGIFHLSGPEMISVHDFAMATARCFSLDSSLISPIQSSMLNQPGKRPVSTGFVLDKASDELDYSPRDIQNGLMMVQNLIDEFSDLTGVPPAV